MTKLTTNETAAIHIAELLSSLPTIMSGSIMVRLGFPVESMEEIQRADY
jgi:hypothetical protein